MTINKTHWLIRAVFLLFPVTGFAQEVPAGQAGAATQLADVLRDTRTLQADVEQLTLDQDGREVQEFQAKLVMEKPDHFYWEIVDPYPELLVTDGITIWRWEPDLEQVTIQPFDQDIDRTPVLLLNGDADTLADNYIISSADMDSGRLQRFILHPVAPDSLFERLSLTFEGDSLREMQFEDSLGQKTSLTFSSLVANEAVDPSVFTYDIPDGVEIIDTTGGQ